MKVVQVLVRVKAKAKVLVLEKAVKEKALQPLGKVERVALVAVAKAKVKENPADRVANPQLEVTLEAVVERVKAKAKAQARAVDRAKALEAVKVQAKAREKVVAKAENLENLEKVVTHLQVPTKNLEAEVQVHHPAKATSVENVMEVEKIVRILPKIAVIVMAQDNNPKITLRTLWKISPANCHKLNKRKKKNRLVRLLGTKRRKTMKRNLMHGHKNVATFLI
ncbi:hypothetical protein CMK18_23420 [Candidatus Poribacteria bacterium]|nr:hypothetical protein [Candidatus Poribacteria bacterium]